MGLHCVCLPVSSEETHHSQLHHSCGTTSLNTMIMQHCMQICCVASVPQAASLQGRGVSQACYCRQQLACRALRRRMLHAWAKAAHHSCHESLLTAAAHDLACHHCLRRARGKWRRATALAHGTALCLAHQKENRVSAAFQAWRLFACDAM
jgi:hypothetical protein